MVGYWDGLLVLPHDFSDFCLYIICIYIYNYIYYIYSYITNDILYLIPWSSYQKHPSLEWVNSPLSLSHSNESSWKIWANYHISPESCGHFGMIARKHDANDGEQWGRKFIYSDQKHHSVTISTGNYHLRWWCEPPVDVVDVSDWRSFLGMTGWPSGLRKPTELWMKKVQNNMVKIW